MCCGTVEFRDVSFRYEDATEKVLDHVSLNVPAGSYVALVGSSGGGKTTLCSLIPRFYDVTGGSVCIDGNDVRDVTLQSLREQYRYRAAGRLSLCRNSHG